MPSSETTGPTIPRFMIAAPHGRSGKTVLTLGLLRALRESGASVQPFKKGPDFIDPGWHTAAAGRTSRNLDLYFMDPRQVRAVLREASSGADVCVIEAAMGLYDGLDASGSASSAEIAKITATPVVLVMDVTRMTRTAGAIALGCCAFDPDVRIAGVILNRVRGERQRKLVTEVVERTCGIPVVGSVPSEARLDLPDRHLGLVTSGETPEQDRLLDGIAAVVRERIDLDAIRSIAASAGPLPGWATSPPAAPVAALAPGTATIVVVRDEAFPFYYPENLIALERSGARLAFAKSMEDHELPSDIDGLYVGGGFPEVFAERLEANEGFRASVRAHARRGLPVFAECGGLMYLGRRLTYRGKTYAMANVLGFDTIVQDSQAAHGYARAVVRKAGSWLDPGTVLVGHEHHHSQTVNLDSTLRFAYAMERGRGIAEGCDGICAGNVVAGYLHVNALSSPAWAPSFVRAARSYREGRMREG